MTERIHYHFSLSYIGERNGNPLQCSCLENPRDSGTWWAAVYGVAQSRTRLTWLSSSSSSTIPCKGVTWISESYNNLLNHTASKLQHQDTFCLIARYLPFPPRCGISHKILKPQNFFKGSTWTVAKTNDSKPNLCHNVKFRMESWTVFKKIVYGAKVRRFSEYRHRWDNLMPCDDGCITAVL